MTVILEFVFIRDAYDSADQWDVFIRLTLQLLGRIFSPRSTFGEMFSTTVKIFLQYQVQTM